MIKAQRLYERLKSLSGLSNKQNKQIYVAVRETLGAYLLQLASQGKLYAEHSAVKGFLYNVNLKNQNDLDNMIVNIDGEYFVREGNEWRNEL